MLQSSLGCFNSLFDLAATFVPHEPPCVIFFLCAGDAASPKAAFGVIKVIKIGDLGEAFKASRGCV